MGMCSSQASPLRGGGSAERRDGERSYQICSNLSVCFADSIPTPFVPSGHFPLIGESGP